MPIDLVGSNYAGDGGLAASTPQNSVLTSMNSFTSDLAALGQSAANIYSTFLGAKSTYNLSQQQKTVTPYQPNVSPANAVDALMNNKSMAFGVLLAVGLTGWLIFKAVK